MAQGYSKELTGVIDGTQQPARKADGRVYGARQRDYRATLALAAANVAKNVADTNVIVRRPKETGFRGGSIKSDVTLGSTTVSIGTATNPTKYMSATTLTTPNVPVSFGNVAAMVEDPITANEDVILTFGAAAAPGAGNIVIDFETLAR